MAENTKGPVAIRIVRPYGSEDELLENELETVGKTSIILIGAHPRPTGIILRFEVTLETGATVLRGEGRVLGHKERAFRGQPGLSLRFTRLDPRSKAVVDRAVAMRDARLSGDVPSIGPSAPSAPSAPPPPARSAPPAPADEPVRVPVSFPAPADPALEAALTAATPDPPPAAAAPPEPELPPTMAPPPVASSASPIDVGPISEPALPRSARGSAASVRAPPDREALLTRLRERRAGLSADRVAAILKH